MSYHGNVWSYISCLIKLINPILRIFDDIYQISGKGVVRYPLIFSRDENIRRGRRPSWIFLGETEYQGYVTIPASDI